MGVGSRGGTEDGRVETQQSKPFRWRSQTEAPAGELEEEWNNSEQKKANGCQDCHLLFL